jgi:hypothetical protein
MSSVAYSFDGNDAIGTAIITLAPISYTFTNNIEYNTQTVLWTRLDDSSNIRQDSSQVTSASSAVTSSSTYENTQYSTTVSDTYTGGGNGPVTPPNIDSGVGTRPVTPLTIVGTFYNIDSGYTGPISDLVSTSSVSYGTSTFYVHSSFSESFWLDPYWPPGTTTVTDYSTEFSFTNTTYYGLFPPHAQRNYNYKIGNNRLTAIGYDSASMEGRNTDLSLVVPVAPTAIWSSQSFSSELSSSSRSYSTGTHEEAVVTSWYTIWEPYIEYTTSNVSQSDGDSVIYGSLINGNQANTVGAGSIEWTTKDNFGGFVKLGQSSNSTYDGFTFGHNDPAWADQNIIGGALIKIGRVADKCPALMPATVAQSPFGYIFDNWWAASWGTYQIDGDSQTQIVNYDISDGQTFGRPSSITFVNSYGMETFDTFAVQQNSLPAIFNGSDSVAVTVTGLLGFTSYTTGSISSSSSTYSFFSSNSALTLTGADLIGVGYDGLVANSGGAGWI